jgi:hypothetical protein
MGIPMDKIVFLFPMKKSPSPAKPWSFLPSEIFFID